MKQFLLTLPILLLFFSANLFGQDTTENSLKQGKFALQFQIRSSFSPVPFQGTTFSGKYHLSDNSALRLGVSLIANVDIENKTNYMDDEKTEYYSLGFNLQFIQYLVTSDDISLFAGGGPVYTGNFNGGKFYDKNWAIGLSGLIGTEWFVKKNIGLSVEYGIELLYRERTNIPHGNGEVHFTRGFLAGSYDQFKVGVTLYL